MLVRNVAQALSPVCAIFRCVRGILVGRTIALGQFPFDGIDPGSLGRVLFSPFDGAAKLLRERRKMQPEFVLRNGGARTGGSPPDCMFNPHLAPLWMMARVYSQARSQRYNSDKLRSFVPHRWLAYLIAPSLLLFSFEDSFTLQRERMVHEQIEARGIRNADVLRMMRSTPRHLFVPEDVREYAYSDRPLPIGLGQTISQPYIVALMTELLGAGKTD